MDSKISVGVRVRPLYGVETPPIAIVADVPKNAITDVQYNRQYIFDAVYGPTDCNELIFDRQAARIVQGAVDGYNGTIFAYGQTGSGKTHTMTGSAGIDGITQLAIRSIFDKIHQTYDSEFLVRVSFCEIYNETLKDLLEPSNTKLTIYDDSVRGAYVKGISEVAVVCPEDAFDLLARGIQHRSIGATAMNDTSSRSHSIFRLVLESRRAEGRGEGRGAEGPGEGKGAARRLSMDTEISARECENNTTDSRDNMNNEATTRTTSDVGAETPLLTPMGSPGECLRSPVMSGAGAMCTPTKIVSCWDSETPVKVAVLNLVDLAGSERVSKTKAAGVRLREGANINKSLLTLGQVISALEKLADGHMASASKEKLADSLASVSTSTTPSSSRASSPISDGSSAVSSPSTTGSGIHVPFRDSKLTRLLQNSLGGNARTMIIATLSPAASNTDESRSTLLFATRARRVVNRPVVNQVTDQSALLSQYLAEIASLKHQMQGMTANQEELEIKLEAEIRRTSQLQQRLQLPERPEMDSLAGPGAIDGGAVTDTGSDLHKLILTSSTMMATSPRGRRPLTFWSRERSGLDDTSDTGLVNMPGSGADAQQTTMDGAIDQESAQLASASIVSRLSTVIASLADATSRLEAGSSVRLCTEACSVELGNVCREVHSMSLGAFSAPRIVPGTEEAADCAKLRSDVELLESQRLAAERERDSVALQKDVLESKVEELTRSLQQSTAEITNANIQLQTAETDKVEAQDQLRVTVHELDQLRQENERLRERASAAARALTEATASHEQSAVEASTKIGALTLENTRLKDLALHVTDDNDTLRSELTRTANNEKALRAQLKSAEDQMSQVALAVKEAEVEMSSQLDRASLRLAAAEAEAAKLRSQLDEARAEETQLKNCLTAHEQELLNTQQQLASLRTVHAAALAQHDEESIQLRTQVKQLMEQLQQQQLVFEDHALDLKTKLEIIQESQTTMQQTHKEEVEALNLLKTDLEAACAMKDLRMQQLVDELSAAHQTAATYAEQSEKQKNELSQVEESFTELSTVTEMLKTQLAEITADLGSLTNQHVAAQEEKNMLQHSLADVMQKLDDANSALATAEEDKATVQAQLENERDMAEKQMQMLQVELNELRMSNTTLESKLESLAALHEADRDSLEKVTNQLRTVENELTKLPVMEEQCRVLGQTKTTLEATVQELEVQLEQARAIADTLTTSLERFVQSQEHQAIHADEALHTQREPLPASPRVINKLDDAIAFNAVVEQADRLSYDTLKALISRIEVLEKRLLDQGQAASHRDDASPVLPLQSPRSIANILQSHKVVQPIELPPDLENDLLRQRNGALILAKKMSRHVTAFATTISALSGACTQEGQQDLLAHCIEKGCAAAADAKIDAARLLLALKDPSQLITEMGAFEKFCSDHEAERLSTELAIRTAECELLSQQCLQLADKLNDTSVELEASTFTREQLQMECTALRVAAENAENTLSSVVHQQKSSEDRMVQHTRESDLRQSMIMNELAAISEKYRLVRQMNERFAETIHQAYVEAVAVGFAQTKTDVDALGKLALVLLAMRAAKDRLGLLEATMTRHATANTALQSENAQLKAKLVEMVELWKNLMHTQLTKEEVPPPHIADTTDLGTNKHSTPSRLHDPISALVEEMNKFLPSTDSSDIRPSVSSGSSPSKTISSAAYPHSRSSQHPNSPFEVSRRRRSSCECCKHHGRHDAALHTPVSPPMAADGMTPSEMSPSWRTPPLPPPAPASGLPSPQQAASPIVAPESPIEQEKPAAEVRPVDGVAAARRRLVRPSVGPLSLNAIGTAKAFRPPSAATQLQVIRVPDVVSDEEAAPVAVARRPAPSSLIVKTAAELPPGRRTDAIKNSIRRNMQKNGRYS